MHFDVLHRDIEPQACTACGPRRAAVELGEFPEEPFKPFLFDANSRVLHLQFSDLSAVGIDLGRYRHLYGAFVGVFDCIGE